MSIKDKFIFWGAVSGLSAVLFGSCYYLYKYMKDIEEEDDDNNSMSSSEDNEEEEDNSSFLNKKRGL